VFSVADPVQGVDVVKELVLHVVEHRDNLNFLVPKVEAVRVGLHDHHVSIEYRVALRMGYSNFHVDSILTFLFVILVDLFVLRFELDVSAESTLATLP